MSRRREASPGLTGIQVLDNIAGTVVVTVEMEKSRWIPKEFWQLTQWDLLVDWMCGVGK